MRRSYITTFSGIQFDLLDPKPEMVHMVDIARHLSQVCRWAGATNRFWSVAQHSVLVSHIVPQDDKELVRWALLHDAAEAYIGDITRPLKALLPKVREIEAIITEVIAGRYDLSFPEPANLSAYDDQIQRLEAEMLMKHDGQFLDRTGDACAIAGLTPDQRRQVPLRVFSPMSPQTAEIMFAMRFRELFVRQIAEVLG